MEIMKALQITTNAIKDWVNKKTPTKLTVDEDNLLYLSNDNGILSDGIQLPQGSGGSGGGSVYSVSLTNVLESRVFTVIEGAPAVLKFNYSSVDEEGFDDGSGIGKITINGIVQPLFAVAQGDNELDVSSMLVVGSNYVTVRVENSEGSSKTLTYTITLVSISITSKFDVSSPFAGEINFPYVANGSYIDKNVYFELDENIIDSFVVSTHGRDSTYTIPAQRHGVHTLRVWFDCVINDSQVTSNVLYFEFMSVETGNTTPMIATNFQSIEVDQYDTIVIPYRVYNPSDLTTEVIQYVDDIVVANLVVNRAEQTWSYRATTDGTHILKITCGVVSRLVTVIVSEKPIEVEATTDNLDLYLTSYGRSNNEINPKVWKFNDIEAKFSGFNFISDGWQLDEDGITVLRVSGDARVEIPTYIFASDFRVTGKTIEIEFASRDVLNYETTIISCMSGGRGIQITPQMAQLFAEQTSIGTQYKEEEHIRISFVIEKRIDNCFLLSYVNGILSSAEIYPDGENFTQTVPVALTIGSNECTTDLYCIRVYNNNLTRYQILNNWIADTQDGHQMIERYSRNQIYNDYGEIAINKLPADLPYLVIEAEVLPQSKGDKKNCSGYYVDVLNPSKSFEFTDAQIDVQGTSSQYYYVKNYKIKFKNGFKIGNTTVDSYQLNDNVIPTNTYTFKADVASSEGANNVVLAQLYNDICPTKTPPQLVDDRVRQTIDGHPIVIFWNNNGTLKFLGKYNFNHDKGTEEVFGFKDGDESWEIKQNGTDRVGWKSDDFESVDGKGNFNWLNDFEARYPEENTNTVNLKALSTWLKSTNIDAATNQTLPNPVTYDDVVYTIDNQDYRLAKFRAELHEHANVDNMIFYYLFTEISLGIDQREKNAFPTLFAEDGRWIMFFYDADSSLGIDNKGKLAFGPYLEDIDYTEGGDPIYNGQGSVLWVNLRKAFYPEIQAMYQQMRTDLRGDGSGDRILSYDVVNRLFEAHQNKWCEAIFNEDMYRKCLEPYILNKDSQYIPMLLGKKEMQRKWWLYNRFRYLDSKYVTGNSMNVRLMIRAKGKSNIKLTSYVDMYGHVYYNSEMVEHRMERGQEYEFVWSASGAEDAVIGVNDADMITGLGDLAPLYVETIDIANATHLTYLKIGDSASTYRNTALTSVTFGNNVLLRSLDLRNCVSLNTAIDISGCSNIEDVYCEGSNITGIILPNGGILKVLHLPDTIANLSVLNQDKITDFYMAGYDNLKTLRIENCSGIPVADIVNGASNLERVRLIDVEWSVESESDLVEVIKNFKSCMGLDINDYNIDKPVVTGRVKVAEAVSDEVLGDIYDNFPDLVVDDGSTDIYIINYKDWDGTILYTDRLSEGKNAIDPIKQGYISAPFRAPDSNYSYEFVGWSTLPTNVSKHYVITAQYTTMVAVNFCVDGTIIHSEYVVYGTDAEDPVANGTIDPPTKEGTDDLHYVFDSWGGSLTNVTLPRTVNAVFSNVYPVRFYATEDSTTPHYVQWVKDGDDAFDPVASGDCETPTKEGTSDMYYTFSNWASIPTNITAITVVYAEYVPNWAVRFYNGDVVENTQWIRNGESAVDPVTAGIIPTPQKASTAQYDYTFSSWNGDYTNVTAPVNVIATYSSTVRKYKIEFYNGDDLVQVVENIPYGSGASYTGSTPVKTGVDNPEEYEFKRWNPAPENITGDTKCYALFKFTGYIQDDWATINENALNGTAEILYQIGGRKAIPITLSDGTETIADVELIAFNHDDLADGTGKASLTFFCKDLPNIQRRMNPSSNDIGGWESSEMREFVNGELFDALPAELQSVIKPVFKISDSSKALITTTDKLWLASFNEVGFTDGKNNLPGQGELYSAVFSSDQDSRVKYITDDTDVGGWWLRSVYYSTSGNTMFYRVQRTGVSYGDMQFVKSYVAFGFCI